MERREAHEQSAQATHVAERESHVREHHEIAERYGERVRAALAVELVLDRPLRAYETSSNLSNMIIVVVLEIQY